MKWDNKIIFLQIEKWEFRANFSEAKKERLNWMFFATSRSDWLTIAANNLLKHEYSVLCHFESLCRFVGFNKKQFPFSRDSAHVCVCERESKSTVLCIAIMFQYNTYSSICVFEIYACGHTICCLMFGVRCCCSNCGCHQLTKFNYNAVRRFLFAIIPITSFFFVSMYFAQFRDSGVSACSF